MFLLRIGIILLAVTIIHEHLLAQREDSLTITTVNQKHFVRSLIIPTSLCVAGVIVKETHFRKDFQEDIQGAGWHFNTRIDDYTQYVPIVELFTADLCYSKTKNEIFQQAKNLAIAQFFTGIIVTSLKGITNITRPDGTPHSFPSGHTSFAFTSAMALYLEYNDSNKLLSYSGFGFSTATGMLRVVNNRHWISDVLVGAGIGMLTSKVVWYINPFSNWKPFNKKKVTFYPYVNGLDSSAGLCIVF
jgi:membrane-associated phospholipid phosphatase